MIVFVLLNPKEFCVYIKKTLFDEFGNHVL